MNTLKSNGREINTTYAFLTIQLSQNKYNSSKTELLVLNNEFTSLQYEHGLLMVVGSP
jgi:hypothetical protein